MVVDNQYVWAIKDAKLYPKKGIYYVKIFLRDTNDNETIRWRSTRIKASRGNKKKATDAMREIVRKMGVEIETKNHEMIQSPSQKVLPVSVKENITLEKCFNQWLRAIKNDVELITYADYYRRVHNKILPYFGKDMNVWDLTVDDVKSFYEYLMDEVKNTLNTVYHVHANLSPPLDFAVEKGWVTTNVASEVKLPKKPNFVFNYYKQNELSLLFSTVNEKDPFFEFAILAGGMYGLRRSEVVGLKWTAIDFDANLITINHRVTEFSHNGKVVRQAANGGKSESSVRSLPLLTEFRTVLLRLKAEQEELALTCGSWYDNTDSAYIYRDNKGNRVIPSYITSHFSLFLKKTGLRKIKYRELRHSCASFLLSRGIPMKVIQKWLGHSSYVVTDKFYAAFDTSTLNIAGDTINQCFAIPSPSNYADICN